MIFDVDSPRFIKEVMERNEYAFLFKDLVVIDVGCNIGTFSFWIHKLAREIHAIDLDQRQINNMNQTIKTNKINKVKTYCMGIAGHAGERKYTKDPKIAGGTGKITDGGYTVIECITLGQFMGQNAIAYADVVKIDVEGLEREVIEAGDFPKDRIHTIVGEIHSDGKSGRHEVRDLLEQMRYRYSEP